MSHVKLQETLGYRYRRPPSRLYRLQKLVRRNQVAFLAALMVALALVGGLSMSIWFWHQEREAHRGAVLAQQMAVRAEQQQARLREEAEEREWISEAAYLVSQKNLEDADELVKKVKAEDLRPSLEAESVLRALGQWHALKGRWREAEERFNLLLTVDQKDNSWAITDDLLMAGPIQIEHGDLPGYERFRRAAIARFLGTTDPIFAERTLKICLLTPADADSMKALETLSKLSGESMRTAGQNAIMESWRCISLAIMAYREGESIKAREWCQKCLAYPEDNPSRIVTAHVIQAMACYRLGEVETARSELAQAGDLANAEFARGLQEGNGWSGFWYDWLFARILLREAEALESGQAAAGE